MRRTKPLLLVVALTAVLLSSTLVNAAPAGARSYLNMKDINCPAWSIREPWTGYAVIGTSAAAICVEQYSGTVWGGGSFTESRPTLLAHLQLFRGQTSVAGAYGYLSNCFDQPANYSVWILHISRVQLCAVDDKTMFTHTGVFPPHGCYYGRLTVRSRSGETLMDQISSGRCF